MNRAIKNEITIIFIAFFIKFVFVADPINENEVELCRQILSHYSPRGDALTFFNNYLNLGQRPLGRNTNQYVMEYGNYAATKVIFVINTVLRAEINEDGQLLRPSYVPDTPPTLIEINYSNPRNVLLDLNLDDQYQNLRAETRQRCVRTLARYSIIYGMYAKEIFYLFFQYHWFSRINNRILNAYAKHVKGSSRRLARDAMNIEQYCLIKPETAQYTIRNKNDIIAQSIYHRGGFKIEKYPIGQAVQQTFQFPEQEVVQPTLQVPEQVVYDTFYVPTTHSYDAKPQNYDNLTTGGAGPSNH